MGSPWFRGVPRDQSHNGSRIVAKTAPADHEIVNTIPIDLDGRFGIDYVAQIRFPWGGTHAFLYQLMSVN